MKKIVIMFVVLVVYGNALHAANIIGQMFCPKKLKTTFNVDVFNKTKETLYVAFDYEFKFEKIQGAVETIPGNNSHGSMKIDYKGGRTPYKVVARVYSSADAERTKLDRSKMKPLYNYEFKLDEKQGKTIFVTWHGTAPQKKKQEKRGFWPQTGPYEGKCGVNELGYDLSNNVQRKDIVSY